MLGKSHMVTTTALMSGLFLTELSTTRMLNQWVILSHNDNSWMSKVVSPCCDFIYWIYTHFMSLFSIPWHISNHWYLLGFLFLLLLFGLIGSLLPDIDSETSLVGRHVKFISSWLPHRSITHTLYAVLLIGIVAFYIDNPFLWAFWLGYFLHIVEDSFSKQGIAWFRPFKGYRKYGNGAVVKKGRKPLFFYYRTGSKVENYIRYLSWFFLGAIWGIYIYSSFVMV